jgi:hypothetical protein
MWNVERQTAHKWFRQGLVKDVQRDGRAFKATERAVREAKVLSSSDLESKFGVTSKRLAEGERSGLVRSQGSRFSLDDLEVLETGPEVPRERTALVKRRATPEERVGLLRELVLQGVPLSEYPDEIFDSEECPPFSPPRPNLFAYALGEYWPDARSPAGVWISRSAGWNVGDDGELRWVQPCADAVWLRPPVFELPPELAHDTQLYRMHEADWRSEWLRRRRNDKKETNI